MARGSVKKRGKTWYYVVPYRDESGAYKRKWERAVAWGFPNTERGAEQALRKRLGELDRGALPTGGGATVGAWVTAYIEGKHVKPNSRYIYRQRARLYIAPHLGDVALRDLTRARVRRWHRDLLERDRRPLSPATVGAAHAILSGALKEAVAEGILTQNVAAAVKPPPIAKGDPEVWSPAQLSAFLREAEADEWRALWLLCAVAGLRRGEALTLRWDDIDWQGRRVIVRRTYSRDADGRRIVGDSPKTRDSLAPVDVPASCIEALREHRDRQAFRKQSAGRLWREQGFVFARDDGSPLPPATVIDRLATLAQRAGVPPMTMRGLRHTAATFAFSRGEHPKTVQAMLRHTRIAMTMDTYTAWIPSMGRESADRAEDELSRLRGEG